METSMSKKDFIALADAIREHNQESRPRDPNGPDPFTLAQIGTLANVLQRSNPRFMRDRWLDYIAGKCGKNGGKV
jgi:hypothetical protein